MSGCLIVVEKQTYSILQPQLNIKTLGWGGCNEDLDVNTDDKFNQYCMLSLVVVFYYIQIENLFKHIH